MNKISFMLDKVADSLEARGYLKEAYEVDKVADAVEAVLSANSAGGFIVIEMQGSTPKKFDIVSTEEEIDSIVANKPKGSCLVGEIFNVLKDESSYAEFLKNGPSKKNWPTYLVATVMYGRITYVSKYESEEELRNKLGETFGGTGMVAYVAGLKGTNL
jgi:hypothetical protein